MYKIRQVICEWVDGKSANTYTYTRRHSSALLNHWRFHHFIYYMSICDITDLFILRLLL
jgi:hypothetical protein